MYVFQDMTSIVNKDNISQDKKETWSCNYEHLKNANGICVYIRSQKYIIIKANSVLHKILIGINISINLCAPMLSETEKSDVL